MQALIIVDIQNDFLPDGALAVPQGNEIIAIINLIQSHYDLVVATQDWHPPGHQSFASSHPHAQVFEETTLNGLPQVLWPDHCIQETAGASLAPGLHTARIEAIFRKGMDPAIDSYSGFFDNGRLKDTGLAAYLQGRGIREVAVCGLAADYCVYYTANDALDLGFGVRILDNACKPISAERYENLKKDFVEKGGSIGLAAT